MVPSAAKHGQQNMTIDKAPPPKRVSKEDWSDSKKGKLGRFPPPNIYEPEEESSSKEGPARRSGVAKPR